MKMTKERTRERKGEGGGTGIQGIIYELGYRFWDFGS
jgi:hypothetical protein